MRAAYGPFALVLMSTIRYIGTRHLKFSTAAYAIVFPICCLNIFGEICTLLVTLATQSLINYYLYDYSVNLFVFEVVFSVACAIGNYAINKTKDGDDKVL